MYEEGRSVISENEFVTKERNRLHQKRPYPKDYHLVPYKHLSLMEEKALLEIEKIKKKKADRLERVGDGMSNIKGTTGGGEQESQRGAEEEGTEEAAAEEENGTRSGR